jgi:signal transduction histidine kinase
MNRLLTVLFFFLVSLTHSAYSQIELQKSFYIDSKSALDITKIQNVEFTPFESDLLRGFSDDTVWVKLNIKRDVHTNSFPVESGIYPLILRVGSLSLDSIELFESFQDAWSVQQLGDKHMTYPRICEDEFHCFNLKSTLEKPITLYLRIQSQNIIEIRPEVVAQKDLARTIAPRIRTSSISIAFAFCLCIIAFIFYLIEKSRLILFYVFFQFSIILYLISNNGLLFDFLKGNYSGIIQYAPEFFFYFRALLLCLLCREIFIGYQLGRAYKIFNNYLLALLLINVLLTFSSLGHKNAAFNILLQSFVLALNFYAILTTTIPARIKISAFIGNAIYATILVSGFLYASHVFESNRFDFLIHNYLDYRLNGIPIGIVIFSIVTFQILEKNKKSQEIINQSISNSLKVELLNEKLIEQEEMVDLLTHEIKNPLNTINYAVKFVQSDTTYSTDITDRAKKIVQSTNRIDSIVNQVYLSTRLERYEQNETQAKEMINFNELITEIASDYEFGNSFVINTDKVFMIKSSRFLLTTILTNLIGNAVKYCTPGSAISISIGTVSHSLDFDDPPSACQGSYLFFEVSNTMELINRPDPDKLFKRYYRHENFLTKPGMGIGLNIVKTAVNILRGTIGFHIESDQIKFKTEIPL